MDITINVVDRKPKKRQGVLSVLGRLTLHDFEESLYVPLDWWSIEDYENQWKEGLDRIKNHDQSCLIATIHDPTIRPYIDWWILYKIDNKIHVQNQLLVADIYQKKIGNKPFTKESCYSFISPRKSMSGIAGVPISEWVVELD